MKLSMRMTQLFFAITVITGMQLLSAYQVYAGRMDSKEHAVQAYVRMLSQEKIRFHDVDKKISSSQCKYALVYVDNDNIPELIIDATDAEQTFHASG